MGKGLKFWIFEVLSLIVVIAVEVAGLLYVLRKTF